MTKKYVACLVRDVKQGAVVVRFATREVAGRHVTYLNYGSLTFGELLPSVPRDGMEDDPCICAEEDLVPPITVHARELRVGDVILQYSDGTLWREAGSIRVLGISMSSTDLVVIRSNERTRIWPGDVFVSVRRLSAPRITAKECFEIYLEQQREQSTAKLSAQERLTAEGRWANALRRKVRRSEETDRMRQRPDIVVDDDRWEP